MTKLRKLGGMSLHSEFLCVYVPLCVRQPLRLKERERKSATIVAEISSSLDNCV